MAPWSDSDAVKLGSGLPDRMILTVRTARAKYPWEKNPQQVGVVIEGEANVEGELSDEHLWLKPGSTFEPGDKDGTFLVHEKQTPDVYDGNGTPKKLNKNSAYGKFLNSITSAENGGFDKLEANQSPDRAKYQIWDLAMWDGMVLDIEMVEEPYSFKNDAGELIEGATRQPYIRAVLGKADGAATTPAASSAPASAPSSNGTINPADFDSYMSYVEKFVQANGTTSGSVSQEEWEASRA